MMTDDELRDNLSLVRIPHVGDVHISQLISYAGSATAVFKMSRKQLEAIPGIGAIRALSILEGHDPRRSEREILFAQKNGIEIIVRGTENYPHRLDQCHDAPHLLFYKGNVPLHQQRILGVVGTRSPTTYGKERAVELMASLAGENVLIVSGLAYGIDTIAHKEAMHMGMSTIGVLAHGLDKIYPAANRAMALAMVSNGGLLTECWQGTKPEKQNFPKRNRIVAGLCDAVVVVESGERGGSLITAGIANSYNRDVFAFPGKATDLQSKGCNHLIRNHQAQLISTGWDLLESMNWHSATKNSLPQQRSLFPELSEEEARIYNLIAAFDTLSIDQLQDSAGMRSSLLAAILLSLELKGVLHVLPGKAYAVIPTQGKL